jgi:predicted DNA-binding ribbon-helix-helix protein
MEFLRARLSEELILLLPVAIPLQGNWDMRKSLVIKRSVVVGGHKTSVSLEDDFWDALKGIAREHRVTLSDLVGSLDEQRQHGNLSSTLRLFVLNHYRQRMPAEGAEIVHPRIWPTSKEAHFADSSE